MTYDTLTSSCTDDANIVPRIQQIAIGHVDDDDDDLSRRRNS